ncbi:hypothetical protein EW146_g5514 [Bondarzewia mesenterica]|uniref:Photolyase/cryptochrome alpha/beta domain-containing protein n=1 Tax=Bondarzewia mesenterica TaxID=1095465 RepID=A0A4S4LX04_9AGAM|nr:hypothetical protein EW146_g5514 [Bondarzewia mesenterica]
MHDLTLSAERLLGFVVTSPNPSPAKRPCTDTDFVHNKISTKEAAAKVDADRPLPKLLNAIQHTIENPKKGDAVVYWMRMEDMRIIDNRALALASAQAKHDNVPLLVLFIISPQDYIAHDRSPRRIDFTLRNLSNIKSSLADLHIPLHTVVHTPRRTLPSSVLFLLKAWNATRLFANIEYEVDELRRDICIHNLARAQGVLPRFVHDKLVIEPDTLETKTGKPFTVFSPFQRQWIAALNSNTHKFLDEAPAPSANHDSIHEHPKYGQLFDTPVPESVEGFECADRDKMREVWPAGHDAVKQMLDLFLHTMSRESHVGLSDPLADGAKRSDKKSRALAYKEDRDRADRNTTSRLSPYLAAGVISARELVKASMEFLGVKKVQADRESGIGVWVQEIAWRDFYTHVMAAFPRVSMGRPFQEKFASVKWETNEEHFKAWQDGRTGVPIVDAAMRQAKTMGWMHNRSRMIAAMFLTKDLMLDWRLGERHFMQQFIDGDLASNNGGWQWSASTGTDPQPYFRIFNPYLQSEKADPTGEYIRTFVPELKDVRGKDIHHPPAKLADKLGYPRPLVDHAESRERALRRYKNPGEE